jgi:hypothetical protein
MRKGCAARDEIHRGRANGIFRSEKLLASRCLFPLFVLAAGLSPQSRTVQLIRTSVAATKADWKAQTHFSYLERDVDEKDGVTSSKTYRVCMIEGSPYSRLIADGGEPLPPREQAAEGEKLRGEIHKRANESPQERAKRVAQYQIGRERMFALLDEMAQAFDFKAVGQQKIDDHEVNVLQATPRPGYEPKSHETKLLTGMKGTLWIDKDSHQWVRVEAETIKPVSMGWFVAKVMPGTEFSLAQVPVMGKFWLPGRFVVRVKARILWWEKNYTHSETYYDYHFGTSSLTSP